MQYRGLPISTRWASSHRSRDTEERAASARCKRRDLDLQTHQTQQEYSHVK